jgi:hypothetical protein
MSLILSTRGPPDDQRRIPGESAPQFGNLCSKNIKAICLQATYAYCWGEKGDGGDDNCFHFYASLSVTHHCKRYHKQSALYHIYSYSPVLEYLKCLKN